MVCFSINWNRDGEFLREQIKSIPPGIFVLVGGRHATENPGQWLEELPNVNAVVRGDGEEAVDELCRGVAMEQITGLSFRRDGKIHHNVNRVAGKLSDDIFPDRSLRRHPYEINVAGKSMGLAIDMVSSSRGCPFNCKFCSFSRNPWGTKREWSARSPESVVNEIEQIDARIIGFTDDLFTYDLDRVSKICDLIIERGLNRNKYVINARLEIAKQPWILRKMERAGFAMLMLGIESAHDKTLKSMNKGFNTAKIREYMKVLRRSRMIMHGYFIMGNIGESIEDMLKIPSFAREIGLDTIALSWLRVEPHSGLEELIAANPGYHVGANGKIFSDHCSAKQMRKLRRRLNGEFYSFGQIAKIASKGFSNDALSFVPGLAKTLPAMAVRLVFDKIRRKKRHARKRD